jgi:hypothetical protein
MVVVMPLFFFSTILFTFVCAWLDILSEKAILPLVIAAFLFSFSTVIVYLYTKRTSLGLAGTYSLGVDSTISQVDSILNRTLQRAYPYANSLIIDCPDEEWRGVVTFVIDRSSIVLIDVSELTDNLIWEIETSIIKKNLETLMITYGTKIGAAEQLPCATYEILERIVGRNELSRLRVFYYPEEHPPLGWKRIKLYWTLSRKLREELLGTDFHIPDTVPVQRGS